MIDNKTVTLGLPLPDLSNMQDEDVPRIGQALTMLDAHAQSVDAALEQESAARKEGDANLAAALEQYARENDARLTAAENKTPGLATKDVAGIVKIGTGITVGADGLIAVTPVTVATQDAAGTVQIGEGLSVTMPSEEEGAPKAGILSLAAHAAEEGLYGKGSAQKYGHLKVTDDFEEGTTATDGVALSPAGAHAMKCFCHQL